MCHVVRMIVFAVREKDEKTGKEREREGGMEGRSIIQMRIEEKRKEARGRATQEHTVSVESKCYFRC